MQPLAKRILPAFLWAPSIAAVLLCAAGAAAFMGWLPGPGHAPDGRSIFNAGPAATALSGTLPDPAHVSCAVCGTIEAARETQWRGEETSLARLDVGARNKTAETDPNVATILESVLGDQAENRFKATGG